MSSPEQSIIAKKLSAPFGDEDIEWRVQKQGLSKAGKPYALCVPFITARAVQDRLDEVVGVARWQDKYSASPVGSGMLCELSLLMPTGSGEQWITKVDGADIEAKDDRDANNLVKSAISNALKRAAVKWGIGRYLYSLEACWAVFSETGAQSTQIDGRWYKYDWPRVEGSAPTRVADPGPKDASHPVKERAPTALPKPMPKAPPAPQSFNDEEVPF